MSCLTKKTAQCYSRFLQIVCTALGIYLIFLLLRYPALSLQYASTGLTLWFQKMIPTLLPFMILSGVLISLNLTDGIVRLLHPLLHLVYRISPKGSYTLVMGFLCGFPMGARIAGQLREQGKLTREEGNCLLAFCNNIGPIYFLSFVVPTLSLKKPLLPFAIMYGIPLLYGILVMRLSLLKGHLPFCRKRDAAKSTDSVSLIIASENNMHAAPESLLSALDASILSSLLGIAKLGGYMVFFNLLNILFVPFSQLPPFFLQLYNCILEITSGINRCQNASPYLVLILLPFGGFSCIAQTYSMIRHTDLSIHAYLFHKLIQTGLTAFCYLLLRPL